MSNICNHEKVNTVSQCVYCGQVITIIKEVKKYNCWNCRDTGYLELEAITPCINCNPEGSWFNPLPK